MRETLHVGVGDLQVSNQPGSELVTYALGSCVAVMLWDPQTRAAGMLHFMLPVSRGAEEKARTRPGMFADTGVPALFKAMYELSCKKERLVVKVAGGAALRTEGEDLFEIGKRNCTVLRKIFWKAAVLVASQDLGGHKARTVRMCVTSGQVVVSSNGEVYEL